ncbi:uncharacterized protein LOC125645643 [Ostrea edulis]|uniref:uncharacterized protein LOC125645643 n=1 Tax=Ostrea edulis TaxID=37623 RepID=UPI0020954BEA|nr:uncharacterized protein LOC125645643 [Ostrea edulis]
MFLDSKIATMFKEFLDFTDTESSKMIKNSSTRWLSLEKCVDRLLHHWLALLSYFNSHDDVEKPGHVKICAAFLRDHEMRLYYHFLSFIMQPLNDFNTVFQADESRIGYLQDEMNMLLRNFLGKFVRAKVIQTSKDFISIPFKDSKNQLNDNIIAIGSTARAYLIDNKEDVPPSTPQRFFIFAGL